jgi:hypothetical protein
MADTAPDGAQLREMLDFNGHEVPTTDEAAFGFISDNEKLKLPPGWPALVTLANIRTGGAPQITLDLTNQFYAVSNPPLVALGLDVNAVNWVIALRHWVLSHNGLVTHNSRHVRVDEVDANVAVPNPAVAPQPGFWAVRRTMNRIAPTLIAMMAHGFRTRGHHWSAEMNVMYDRLWSACLIALPTGLARPSWEALMRVALHPFGIAAIQALVDWLHADGKLPPAMALRQNAAPCGTAAITSCRALCKAAQSEEWWAPFAAVHSVEINAVDDATTAILGDWRRHHQNRGLYGAAAAPPLVAPVTGLAPILMGWVDTLPAASPLKGIRALNKIANDNVGLRNSFRDFVDRMSRSKTGAASYAVYFGPAPAGVAPVRLLT